MKNSFWHKLKKLPITVFDSTFELSGGRGFPALTDELGEMAIFIRSQLSEDQMLKCYYDTHLLAWDCFLVN